MFGDKFTNPLENAEEPLPSFVASLDIVGFVVTLLQQTPLAWMFVPPLFPIVPPLFAELFEMDEITFVIIPVGTEEEGVTKLLDDP